MLIKDEILILFDVQKMENCISHFYTQSASQKVKKIQPIFEFRIFKQIRVKILKNAYRTVEKKISQINWDIFQWFSTSVVCEMS